MADAQGAPSPPILVRSPDTSTQLAPPRRKPVPHARCAYRLRMLPMPPIPPSGGPSRRSGRRPCTASTRSSRRAMQRETGSTPARPGCATSWAILAAPAATSTTSATTGNTCSSWSRSSSLVPMRCCQAAWMGRRPARRRTSATCTASQGSLLTIRRRQHPHHDAYLQRVGRSDDPTAFTAARSNAVCSASSRTVESWPSAPDGRQPKERGIETNGRAFLPGDGLHRLLQVLPRAGDVDPGRVQRVVAHQLGEPVQGDRLRHAVAEAVAQVVGREVRHLGQVRIPRDQVAEGARRDGRHRRRGAFPIVAPLARREEAGRVLGQGRQVGPQRVAGRAIQGHLPVLVALAVDAHHAAARADRHVLPAQAAEHLGAQPGVQGGDQLSFYAR
jgi:hypothetical protein